MSIFTFILVAFIPFIFSVILAFCLIKKNVSVCFVLLATLFSFLAIFISSIFQLVISFFLSHFLTQQDVLSILFASFIYSGAIEEIIKFIFFYYLLVFFKPSNIEVISPIMLSSNKKMKMQLIILAIFFASCFASFENIAYIVLDIKLLPIRLITASLFHISIAPYYLKAISKTKNIYFSFLSIPILLHGIYNMFVMIGGIFSIFSFILIFFLLVKTYQTTITPSI